MDFGRNAHDQYTNPLARTLLIALQVVRTSFGIHLRKCMESSYPPPLPPFLAIRNHDQIKGICVLGRECKLSQYADDTTLILDDSDNQVRESYSRLDSFAAISGLRINYEKTDSKLSGLALPGYKEE